MLSRSIVDTTGIVTGALASAALKIENDKKEEAPAVFHIPGAALSSASFLGVGGAVIAAGAIAGSTTGLVNCESSFKVYYV